jgi:hypothetical protein
VRSPAARARAPRRPALDQIEPGVPEPVPVSDGRPFPVGSLTPLWDTDEKPAPEDAQPVETRAAPIAAPRREMSPVDRPIVELVIAAAAFLLGGSVFFPWYHIGFGTVSGWSSGTWGPIIFFSALASFVIVVLRRVHVPIAFPVEATLVVEGLGWVSVIGLIFKRYFAPSVLGSTLATDGWIFASLLFALALAILGGMASSSAPFVVRPGWFRGNGGKIGAGVLGIALAAGLTLGFANQATTQVAKARTVTPPTQVKGFPPCARRLHLPSPAGFTPTQGFDYKGQDNCIATFSTKLSLTAAYDRYTKALKAGGWTLVQGRSSTASRVVGIRGPVCGTVAVLTQKTVTVSVIVFACTRSVPSQ